MTTQATRTKAAAKGARPRQGGGPRAVASSSGVVRRFGLWGILLLVVVGLSIASPTFRQPLNLMNILEQNAIIGIVACGMALMMVAGGFDLSVGAVGATAAVAGAAAAQSFGTVGAIVAALAVGIGVGTVNGLLVSRVKVNAFIVTLSMSSVVLGLLYVATGAESISIESEFLRHVATDRWFGVPVIFLLFGACIIAVWLVLTRTKYGHYIYSVGGNAEASHLSGVPVESVQLFAFTAGGFFAGMGGLLLLGQTTIGQPSAAADWALRAIAICVVAGIALTGGIGRAPDVLAATLLLGVIGNGLNQLSVSPYWQPTVTGLVILAAVTLDQFNRVRSSSAAAPAGPVPATPGNGRPEGTDAKAPALAG